ncbi:MAG: hypothetical protein INH41_14810 [Myxococcaceae bacterium]|jgi:hypothetical protein|nr:hypothetical protein [Myxococcaceae bacterium]
MTASCPLDCGAAGRCELTDAPPRCVCAPGRTGDRCGQCAQGLQDLDGDGVCLPDCSTLSCGYAGTCQSGGGTARCVCAGSRAGARCEVCADGYQDNDRDGVCLPTCRLAALTCGRGTCSDVTGVARCACFPGFGDAGCSDCAAGQQDNNADGVCEPRCSPSTCGPNGTCNDSGGRASCACAAGYAQPDCRACADGYQDNDRDGVCLPTCRLAALGCGSGTCSDVTGVARCACFRGFGDAGCSDCAAGQQDNNGDGVCEPRCSPSTCGPSGTCNDSSGRASCACAVGYAQPDCRACAPGFQDNDSNGSCLATCATATLSCGVNGACSDVTGTARCQCGTGYSGADCAACASGFQDDDGNGSCAATCASAPFSPDAGSARLTLRLDNFAGGALGAGSLVVADLSSTLARGWGQPDGGGLAVFRQLGDGGLLPVARQLTSSPDGGVSRVAFTLAGPVPPGMSDRSYGVHRTPSALNLPSLPAGSLATRTDDVTKTLFCDLRGDFFFSIQLRQIGTSQYEINVADGTFDSAAYARIVITDALTNTVLRDSTYGNGAGMCCTNVTFIARETLTITSPLFRVRLETREFSGTRRYFGCDTFLTGNPPTSQVGATEFTFTTTAVPVTAVACGE